MLVILTSTFLRLVQEGLLPSAVALVKVSLSLGTVSLFKSFVTPLFHAENSRLTKISLKAIAPLNHFMTNFRLSRRKHSFSRAHLLWSCFVTFSWKNKSDFFRFPPFSYGKILVWQMTAERAFLQQPKQSLGLIFQKKKSFPCLLLLLGDTHFEVESH